MVEYPDSDSTSWYYDWPRKTIELISSACPEALDEASDAWLVMVTTVWGLLAGRMVSNGVQPRPRFRVVPAEAGHGGFSHN
jgi:hypothetical protein